MPERFLVRGGKPLAGTVRPAGNKNAALPILAATLLADGPVEVGNIPRIRDVEAMLSLLEHLGATVEWTGPNQVRVDARNAQSRPLDPGLCARIRASILLAGPLLARFGSVQLPPPGGGRHRPPPDRHPRARARAARCHRRRRRPLRNRSKAAHRERDLPR